MRIILVGGGQTIYFLARQFAAKNHHVTAINRSPAECLTLAQHIDARVVQGDGSNPAVLEDAGARRADVVLALTSHDHDNLIVCQVAHRLFGVPRTIALVHDPDNEEIFRRLGVSMVVCATRVIANLLEEQTGFDEIANLIAIDEGRVNVAEVIVRAAAPAVNKTLRELALPQGVLVGSIVRDGDLFIPNGDTQLHADDRIILISHPTHEEEALRILVGAEK